jgi:hypothetical protein
MKKMTSKIKEKLDLEYLKPKDFEIKQYKRPKNP